MSLCDPYPMAVPLNYCSTEDYGPGVLRIGTLPVDREPGGLAVLLTNLATGRVQIAGLVGDDLEVVDIEQPQDLAPGTVYEIKVTAVTDTTGIHPIPFFPYMYEGGAYITAYDTIQGVNVKFIKIFDGLDVHSHSEQYVALA